MLENILFIGRRILENNCGCRQVGRGCKGLRYYLSCLDGDASLCVICIYYHNICEILAGDPRGTRDQRITQNYSFGFDADLNYREGRETLAWSWHQDMFTMFTSHDDTL